MKETHEFKFTHLITPRHIWDLFKVGDITIREMMLVSVIHSLAGSDGCYASNAYLSELMEINPSHMGKLLARLKSMGLIQWCIREEDNKRLLKTYFNECENWPQNGVRANAEGPRQCGGGVRANADPAPSKEGIYSKGDNSARGAEGFGVVGKSWCEKAASVFIRELSAKRLLMRQPSTKAWAKEFQALLDQGVSKAELKETIVWYVQMTDLPYMPQAYSARTFREKYPAIRRRFVKDSKVQKLPDVKPEDLNQWDRMTYDTIMGFGWPSGIRKQVCGLLVLSQQNYKAFVKKADAVEWKGELKEFHKRIRMNCFCSAGTTMTNYFTAVREFVATSTSWDGDVLQFVWAPDIKLVQRLARKGALDAQVDPTLYPSYLEALGYAR